MSKYDIHILSNPFYLKQRDYWISALRGIRASTDIRFPNSGDVLAKDRLDNMEFEFPGQLNDKILGLGKNNDFSVYLLLLLGVKYLLRYYFGNNDIVIKSPLFKSNISELTINNYVYVRIQFRENKTVKDDIMDLKDVVVNNYKNQDYPTDELMKYLHDSELIDSREVSRITCSYNQIHRIEDIDNISEDFNIQFYLEELVIKGKVTYYSKKYPSWMVEKVISHLEKSCHFITDVNYSFTQFNPMTEYEMKEILSFSAPQKTKINSSKGILNFFNQQVKTSPDRIAYVGKSSNYTYKEVNKRSEVLSDIINKTLKNASKEY